MKIKNKWDGITVIVKSQPDKPIHEEKRWGGLCDAGPTGPDGLVQLTRHEVTNLGEIELKLGGFEYEVEMSVEEGIQNIKNIKTICQTIREEIELFLEFGVKIQGKVEAMMDNKTEARPESESRVVPVSDGSASVVGDEEAAESDIKTSKVYNVESILTAFKESLLKTKP